MHRRGSAMHPYQCGEGHLFSTRLLTGPALKTPRSIHRRGSAMHPYQCGEGHLFSTRLLTGPALKTPPGRLD